MHDRPPDFTEWPDELPGQMRLFRDEDEMSTAKSRPKSGGEPGPRAAPAWPGPTIAPDCYQVPIERIEPEQPRTEVDPDSIAPLADSLRTLGLLEPIRVRRVEAEDDGGHRYRIVDGERRWRAARLAGLPSLTCVVATSAATAADVLVEQLASNLSREDLEPLQEAAAYRRVLDATAMPQSQLAEQVGRSPAHVARMLAILKLPQAVRDLIESGDLPADTAYALVPLVEPAAQIALAGLAAADGLTRSEVRRRVERALAERTRPAVPAQTFRGEIPEESPPPESPPKPGAPATDDGAAAAAAGATPGTPPAGPMEGQAGAPGTLQARKSWGLDDCDLPPLPGAPGTRLAAPVPPIFDRPAAVREPANVAEPPLTAEGTGFATPEVLQEDRSAPAPESATEPGDFSPGEPRGDYREFYVGSSGPLIGGIRRWAVVKVNCLPGKGNITATRALRLALTEALRRWPEQGEPGVDYDPIRDPIPPGVAQCNRCHRRRARALATCPQCQCPEFSVSRGEGK
jgi:ParB family chromosome partitioning protein